MHLFVAGYSYSLIIRQTRELEKQGKICFNDDNQRKLSDIGLERWSILSKDFKFFYMEKRVDWIEYEKNLLNQQKNKKSKKYRDKWLVYTKGLWSKNLPIIFTQEHLCALLGYEPAYVYAVSNSPQNFYCSYQIPKKSGGKRKISEPLPNLKEIQKWILQEILYQFEVSPYAKAYVKNKSIKDNVRFHSRQKKVLSLDIKDFFDNLKSWMVYQLFL